MRYTRKYKNSYNVDEYYTNGKISSGIVYIDDNKNFTNGCIAKLGQLEDIEEELGIDLITFVEIIKHYLSRKNVFAKSGEKHFYAIDLENGYVALKDISGGALLCGHRIKDYGKTWALTKEELL